MPRAVSLLNKVVGSGRGPLLKIRGGLRICGGQQARQTSGMAVREYLRNGKRTRLAEEGEGMRGRETGDEDSDEAQARPSRTL